MAEFSERTRDRGPANLGYVLAQIRQDDKNREMQLPQFTYAIRQPLCDGKNFIDYLTAFCRLYEDVLPYQQKESAPGSYVCFIHTVIEPVDGTLFSKELFEISLLCYAHRFGTDQLYEAALWLFRAAYAIRLTHEKTNREDAVPVFLRGFPLLDLILHAFDHQEVIADLQQLQVKADGNHLEGNTVKSRYLGRLGDFFGADFHIAAKDIDGQLIRSFHQTLCKA